MSTETDAPPALTTLTEEETMFRDAVREFAQGEIAPRVQAMEKAGCYDASLLEGLFGMGLMAIDVPETYGGAGGSFFLSILAVEEISKADAAVGVLVDVQNTLFNNALVRPRRPQAVDHERGRGRPVPDLRQRRSVPGLSRHHRLHRREGRCRLHRREERK